MAILKTDSPLARRIALSVLHFLDSVVSSSTVEPAFGVDQEGLEVAKECLLEAFKIDLPSMGPILASESLVDIFSSREQMAQFKSQEDFRQEGSQGDQPCTTSVNAAGTSHLDTSPSQIDRGTREDHTFGTSKDELFGQFFGALEKIHYFSMSDGNDDQVRLDRATNIFHKALEEMQRSGCETFDRRNLADTLKAQGNKAMQLKFYSDAVELYTFAIALCEDNAVYYCNRAAAYTHLQCYNEAVKDCMKSIEIDPNYSKAYSRLGFAYYSQGNYRDAIDKGFTKALQLDPNNSSVKENIRVAEQKLREEQYRTGQNQSTAGSRNHSVPPQFTSLPFDIGSMFMNMASNLSQGGQNFQGGQEGSFSNSPNEPGMGMAGNVNAAFGEHMPEDLSGALRSVMQMFSGAAPSPGNPSEDGDASGRQAPR